MLYLIFLKMGMFAFGGGYAVIPLIEKYVVKDMGLLSMKELLDLISISQMTPGPIAINSATFVGQKTAGIIGAISATSGIVTFQFVLMMILGHFLFTKHKKFKTLDSMLEGIKAGVASLIFITSLELLKQSLFRGEIAIKTINPAALITFALGLILYLKKIDLFRIIAISASIGLVADSLIHYLF